MAQSIEGPMEHASTPIASAGVRNVLRTAAFAPFSGAAGTTVLPASGAWTQSEVIAVRHLRRLVVEVFYNAHGSTTTGYPQLLAMLSSVAPDPTTGLGPAVGDDVWGLTAVSDGVVTAGALAAGTIGTGSDFTVSASFGACDYREQVINCKAALANSDKLRMRLSFDVTDALWFMLQAREIGDTTNRGILNLAIVGGC